MEEIEAMRTKLALLTVPEEVKVERLKILQDEIQKQQFEFNQSMVGKILPVLFEKAGKFSDQVAGKSPYLQSVHVTNGNNILGSIAKVRITKALQTSLAGELV